MGSNARFRENLEGHPPDSPEDRSAPRLVPRAAIFDMDGTMLDTEGQSGRAWIEGVRRFGRKIDWSFILKTVGLNEASARKLYLEELGEDFPYEEVRAEVRRILQEEIEREGVIHKPGLLFLLDRLRERNIPLAVATSSSRAGAVRKLEKAGILDRFSAMVFGDEVLKGKPAPEIFLRAAEKLGKAPEECVGFEDSPAGLLALSRAGIPSVFIRDLIEPPEETLQTVWRRYGNLREAAELF